MINLNDINGASAVLRLGQIQVTKKFDPQKLIGVEMGIAYGGGVEDLAALWKGRGIVYGYDTFEDLHPRYLSRLEYSFEARCMDNWYDPSIYGTAALSYEFQRKQLDTEGLTNVILRKGLITKDSCHDLPVIHYALLDMDILESMQTGYAAVKDKLIPGSLLFLHDVVPKGHIIDLHEWFYDDIMKNDTSLRLIGEWPEAYLMGVEKL